MKPISSESVSENHVRQWLRELTDYNPQQIDKALERMKEEVYKAA